MGKIRQKVFVIHLHARKKISMGFKKKYGTPSSEFADESDSLEMKKLAGEHAHRTKTLGSI